MVQRLHISSYDPRWVLEFEAERDRIAHVLGELAHRIEHNGSTAVPRLEAKPIIDIQVSVEQLQPIPAYAEPLATLGYVHVPHADDAFSPFFHRPREWPHAHHVHVVQSGGEEERRTLAFRDFLPEHSDVAREYATLKKSWALRPMQRTLPLARLRTQRASLSSAWFRSHWLRSIHAHCDVVTDAVVKSPNEMVRRSSPRDGMIQQLTRGGSSHASRIGWH